MRNPGSARHLRAASWASPIKDAGCPLGSHSRPAHGPVQPSRSCSRCCPAPEWTERAPTCASCCASAPSPSPAPAHSPTHGTMHVTGRRRGLAALTTGRQRRRELSWLAARPQGDMGGLVGLPLHRPSPAVPALPSPPQSQHPPQGPPPWWPQHTCPPAASRCRPAGASAASPALQASAGGARVRSCGASN